jgi:hypothetical protein
MRNWQNWIRLFVTGCVAACLVSCGGGIDLNEGGSDSSGSAAKTGTLKMYVQTNPVYFLTAGSVVGFYEVNLRLKSVQVHHKKSKKWLNVPLSTTFNGKTVDFKKFSFTQNQDHLLAENTVPAGHYDEVKIVFDQNQPGQIRKNDVLANTGAGNSEARVVNYSEFATNGLILPASINVTAGGSAWLGLTMDLRSLFGMIDGTYTYKPVAMAVDLNEAGNIEVNVGTNNGDVLVSAQRNGKIVRSLYAPAAGGKVLLTQLPKSTTLADTYQVVLTSSTTATKIINHVPVNSGGQTTSLMSATPITFAPIANTSKSVVASKPSSSEVMGVMGAELIQNVKISDTETLPVVAAYTVSPVSELAADSLLRNVSFTYVSANAQVADYYTLPLQFQATSAFNPAFSLRVDPDLNSYVLINNF